MCINSLKIPSETRIAISEYVKFLSGNTNFPPIMNLHDSFTTITRIAWIAYPLIFSLLIAGSFEFPYREFVVLPVISIILIIQVLIQSALVHVFDVPAADREIENGIAAMAQYPDTSQVGKGFILLTILLIILLISDVLVRSVKGERSLSTFASDPHHPSRQYVPQNEEVAPFTQSYWALAPLQ